MDHFEVDRALDSMTILIDTREQDTPALRRRIKEMGCGIERVKLDVGDYSCKCILPDGGEYSLQNDVVIERKMSVDELCACFARGRERFTREFERAASAGITVTILVENATWEDILSGKYRSRTHPNALAASICAWLARYNVNLLFCDPKTTGTLIKRLLRYELKERLEKDGYKAARGTA